MAFSTGTGRPLQARGGAPGFRFALFAILSVVVMFLDQRHGYLEQARFYLQAAAYPLELAVNSPSAALRWTRQAMTTREALEAENRRLRAEGQALRLRTLRFEALDRENGQLRGLSTALPPVADRWLAAEIVDVQLSGLRQRVLINRGTSNGVFRGQALLDERGLVGQTMHVGPWSAEVILITDPEHATPVLVERTGLRTIAVGTGEPGALALPYLPGNADVKSGDLLLTSGLGGVFPAGYPVARVTEVHRDAVQPLAQVRAAALARVDTDREVMLVWFRADHPAAPGPPGTAGAPLRELQRGNPALQPQPAPPKVAPVAPSAPTPAAGPAAPTGPAASAATGSPAVAAPAARAPAAPVVTPAPAATAGTPEHP